MRVFHLAYRLELSFFSGITVGEAAVGEIVKTYSTEEVTVVWRPEKCQHSANCFRSLPEVFNVRVNPWIMPENAPAERVREVVRACPSGALSLAEDTPPAGESAADSAGGDGGGDGGG